ncbi:MAG: FMN-binding protein [Bacillota bacterium]|nr:FMN-binding protein [Bacillota bacterium]MDW7676782.1 FMN-binding protein [Bacillota bacterium]
MDKQQIKGVLILIVMTAVILGSLSMTGTTGATAAEALTLTGSGQGYNSEIILEVTMDGDTITAIDVVEAGDTPGLSDNAFDTIIEAVLASQTVEGVDVVTGATGSSEGILSAIRDALGGEAGAAETNAEVDETAEAEAPAEAPAVVEGDTYTGSGQGYNSTITVEVIITEDGTIGAINVVEAGDTPGLSDNAFDAIIEAVLAEQSVEGVDVVTGATGSSEGILEAIRDALAQ